VQEHTHTRLEDKWSDDQPVTLVFTLMRQNVAKERKSIYSKLRITRRLEQLPWYKNKNITLKKQSNTALYPTVDQLNITSKQYFQYILHFHGKLLNRIMREVETSLFSKTEISLIRYRFNTVSGCDQSRDIHKHSFKLFILFNWFSNF